MKLNKLPKMVILKPFASIPKITESRTFKVIKYSAYAIIAVALLASVMYLNVIREQVLFLQKPVATAEQTEVLVINQTATMIARDGNLPLAVAKKYAIWVYEAAAKYAVDPILLVAVMATESKFDYKAVSPSGPIGLFQIHPSSCLTHITTFLLEHRSSKSMLLNPVRPQKPYFGTMGH
jgi:soluble lytic murein transglycosylase-like protein